MSRPTSRAASPEDVGRSCPYCRFAFKQGTDIVACGDCHAAHHADCWDDNGGCAILGCASAPPSTAHSGPTVRHPVAAGPATGGVPPAQPPVAAQPPAPAPPARQGLGTTMVVACIVALLAAGVAIAAVATRSPDPPPTSSDTTTGEAPGTGIDGGEGTGTDPEVSPPPPPPPASGALKVVRAHFEYLGSGEYQRAFNLFLPSYQSSAGSSWIAQRSAAAPKVNIAILEPSTDDGSFATLDAKIYTRDTARVSGSDRQCRRFEGTLAARKSGGRWYYSPAENSWRGTPLPSATSECP